MRRGIVRRGIVWLGTVRHPPAGPPGRRLALTLAVALAATLWAQPLAAQEAVLLRSEFAGQAERPEAVLAPGAAVRVADQRWRVSGAERMRVVSPDPEVAAVFRLRPTEATSGPVDLPPGTALRLTVIVIAGEHARHYQYMDDGARLQPEAIVPQRTFRVGLHGQETALGGTPGRVTEIVIQDDADVELRLRQEGSLLELEALPPALGGEPGGARPPSYEQRPLRFVDAHLLALAYTDNALGELWLGQRAAARVQYYPADEGDWVLVRGLVTAQAWRSHTLSLWVEGGGAWSSLRDLAAQTDTREVTLAGGATLHWRSTSWGAALNVGLVGEETALAVYGGWQVWRPFALVLAWHSFAERSGYGLGAALGF